MDDFNLYELFFGDDSEDAGHPEFEDTKHPEFEDTKHPEFIEAHMLADSERAPYFEDYNPYGPLMMERVPVNDCYIVY